MVNPNVIIITSISLLGNLKKIFHITKNGLFHNNKNGHTMVIIFFLFLFDCNHNQENSPLKISYTYITYNSC